MPSIKLSVERHHNGSALAGASVSGKSRVFSDGSTFDAVNQALEWAVKQLNDNRIDQAINDAWDNRMLVRPDDNNPDDDEWADDEEIVRRISDTPYVHIDNSKRKVKVTWSADPEPSWPETNGRFKLAIKKIIASSNPRLIALATAALEDILDE